MKTKIILTVLAILWLNSEVLIAQTADEILDKMNEVVSAAPDQKSELKISIVDRAGKESIRTATLMSLGNDYMLFRFLSPASQAGISILNQPDNIMYLYLPAYAKERRINSSTKGQKFAGTDFCYEDMQMANMNKDYKATIISQDEQSWRLRLVPKEAKKPVYSKLEIKVLKENYYAQEITFFHKKTGEAIKILTNKKIEQIDNYWVATLSEMKDLKTHHKTIMEITSVNFSNGFSSDNFTLRELKK